MTNQQTDEDKMLTKLKHWLIRKLGGEILTVSEKQARAIAAVWKTMDKQSAEMLSNAWEITYTNNKKQNDPKLPRMQKRVRSNNPKRSKKSNLL
jgi:hypothetical protein